MKFKWGALLLLFITTSAFSQDITYSLGIKGGINYSLGSYIEESTIPEQQFDAQSQIGYQGGIFAQWNFGKIFLRPELTYSSLKTEYDLDDSKTQHQLTKIDFPLLLGYNIIGPLDLYAGPVYSNIRTSDIEINPDGSTARVAVQGTPGVNLQAGLKFALRRFEVDLRYERTLTSSSDLGTEVQFSSSHYGISRAYMQKPMMNKVALSIGFQLFGNAIENSRGRGGWCY